MLLTKAFALAGFACLIAAASMVAVPLGFATAGACLLAVAVDRAR